VLGNVRIESDAFVGAGAIVTVNVKQGETVVGINRSPSTPPRGPARLLRHPAPPLPATRPPFLRPGKGRYG